MANNGMKIFLGITMAIILFGLINLGIQTFYPSPEYNDYCAASMTFSPPYSNIQIRSDGISLMQHETEGYYGCFGCGVSPAMCIDPIMEMRSVEESLERYCNTEFEVIEPKVVTDTNCWEGYDIARDNYNSQIFYVLVALGVLLAVSALFQEKKLAFQVVGLGAGSALMIEGILRNLNDKVPALIAGIIAFALLAYFVNKKVEN